MFPLLSPSHPSILLFSHFDEPLIVACDKLGLSVLAFTYLYLSPCAGLKESARVAEVSRSGLVSESVVDSDRV